MAGAFKGKGTNRNSESVSSVVFVLTKADNVISHRDDSGCRDGV